MNITVSRKSSAIGNLQPGTQTSSFIASVTYEQKTFGIRIHYKHYQTDYPRIEILLLLLM